MTSRCFLLGSDNNQREYVEWMLDQLRSVDASIEVIVADFCGGMSDLPVTTIAVDRPKQLEGWYIKPFAIAAAHDLGYEQVCWLDNDLQIIENIDSIFENAHANKLGLAPDGYAVRRSKYMVWNSGVVLSSKSPPCLIDWMERCTEMIERGDQEALAYVASVRPDVRRQIYDLPVVFNWLRLMGEPKQTVKIRHWTGPVGKRHIRENLWK